VAGIDHEHESVAATRENADVNGVRVRAALGDLLRDGPVPTAPTVVANLVRPLLAAVADAGFDGPPPHTLVVSGLLHDETDAIAAAFGRFGLRERARRHSGEWAALTLACDEPGTRT
jgi:ribosomal protein L11 methyltransferase